MTLQRWDNSFGASAQALPFASLPDPASASGQVRLVSDVGPAPGIYLVSDGTIWKPLNGRATLYHRNTNPITVQSLTEATAETAAFPGGLVRKGMRVNVDARVSGGASGTPAGVFALYMGPAGSSSSVAGRQDINANHIRKTTTIECLSDGSTTHFGGINGTSGMQIFNLGVGYFPLVDFSAPWEARIAITSGTYAAVNITAASWAANVVTFTATAHTLAVGDKTVVSAATPSGYNRTYIVASVPDANTFTAELLTDPGAYVSGGTSSRISNMILQALSVTLEA